MRAWHCPYLIEKNGRRYDRLHKAWVRFAFFVLRAKRADGERIGFVGLRGWMLYVYENKMEIACEQPVDGFVSHFLLFRASDAVTEHNFLPWVMAALTNGFRPQPPPFLYPLYEGLTAGDTSD
jgi:hypothetical protein